MPRSLSSLRESRREEDAGRENTGVLDTKEDTEMSRRASHIVPVLPVAVVIGLGAVVVAGSDMVIE